MKLHRKVRKISRIKNIYKISKLGKNLFIIYTGTKIIKDGANKYLLPKKS